MLLHATVVLLLVSSGYVDSTEGRRSECRPGEQCVNVESCPGALAEMQRLKEKGTSEDEGGRKPEDPSLSSIRPFCGYDITSSKYRFKVCCRAENIWTPISPRRSGGNGEQKNNAKAQKNTKLTHEAIYDAIEVASTPWGAKKIQKVCQQNGPGFRHKKLNLLPRDCGNPRATDLLKDLEQQITMDQWGRQKPLLNRRVKRVFHGTESGTMSQPWMARLVYNTANSESKESVLCGGTLINERYVLTAAHCVKDTKDAYLVGVVLGQRHRGRKVDCDRGRPLSTVCASEPLFFSLESVHVHRNFQSHTMQSDIALIRLRKSVNISPMRMSVAPICLPTGRLLCESRINRTFTVAGWGKSERNRDQSEVLRTADLSEVSLKECRRRYMDHNLALYIRPINTFTMCAIGHRQDSCKGDSGGPLQMLSEEGVVVQLGIVSYGSPSCDNFEVPAVYTLVTRYMRWILDVIEP